jgi:hypothetical protein
MSLIPLRIGTPLFVARLIRNPIIPGPWPFLHLPMPQLEGDALKLYKNCVENRLDKFRLNEAVFYNTTKKTDIRERYSHRPSYDAESILWLLLWWAIQIQPDNGKSQDRIPGSIWVDLTGGKGELDHRGFFLSPEMPNICHPFYRELDQLLKSLFKQLSGYQEFVTLRANEYAMHSPKDQDDTRMDEEYLHEALQRTILAFIVENKKRRFMKAQISPTRRLKEEGAGVSQSSKSVGMSMKRTRNVMEQEGNQGTNARPRKKQKNSRGKMKREGTVKEDGTVRRGGPRTRATMKQYVARTFSYHVGADILAGA